MATFKSFYQAKAEFMKAARRRVWDLEDIYGDSDFDPFEQASPDPPTRSATLDDFRFPDLLGDEEEVDDEEEDDRPLLESCFDQLSRQVTWDRKMDYEICHALRALGYSVADVISAD
jgi:hypothetical protein